MGYLDVSPGVGMRHLEGPINPDGLNLGIHVFVSVYKIHMCIYMLRGGMRSWTNCFFLEHIFSSIKEKQKIKIKSVGTKREIMLFIGKPMGRSKMISNKDVNANHR